jgi:hypothetical protein
MENNTNTGTVYSNPNMTADQMAIFEKECIWNDGWYSGRRNGYTTGVRNGFAAGVIVAGCIFVASGLAAFVYKTWKTNEQNKRENESNAEN